MLPGIARYASYKNYGKTWEEMRRRRSERQRNIRKEKREEKFEEKRLAVSVPEHLRKLQSYTSLESYDRDNIPADLRRIIGLLSVEDNGMIGQSFYPSFMWQLQSILRKFKCVGMERTILDAVKSILSFTRQPLLFLAQNDLITVIDRLFDSTDSRIVHEAVIMLAKVAGTEPESLKWVHQTDAVSKLVEFPARTIDFDMLRDLARAISKVTSEPSLISERLAERTVDAISAFTSMEEDDEEIADNAISAAADIISNTAFIKFAVEKGIIPPLLPYTGSENPSISMNMLRLLTNLFCGTGEEAKVALNADTISFIEQMVKTGTREIKKKALHAISKLADLPIQYSAICLDHDLIQPVIKILLSEENDMKELAASVLTCVCKNELWVHYLLRLDGVPQICKMLDIEKCELRHNLLRCLLAIFEYCSYHNLMDWLMYHVDDEGQEKLELLSWDYDRLTSRLCSYIVYPYFYEADQKELFPDFKLLPYYVQDTHFFRI